MKKYLFLKTLVFVYIFILLGCSNTQKPEAEKDARDKEVNLVQFDKQESSLLLKELKQGNPFHPDHVSTFVDSERKGEGYLKGIVWDERSPYAIIGESIVKEGDIIGNRKVLKINKDSIVMEEEGEKIVVILDEMP